MSRHNPYFPETEPFLKDTLDSAIPTVDERVPGSIGGLASVPDGDGAAAAFLGLSVGGRRLAVFFMLAAGVLAVLLGRAGYLDIVRGASYRKLAEGNRIRIVPIPAERGVIHDRQGRLLVRNVPDFTLTAVPADLPKGENERKALLVDLADILQLTPVDIETALARYPANFTSAVPIKEHLDYDKAALLEVRSGAMPGVALDVGTTREYLLSATGTDAVLSMSHVLGYEGRINEDAYARLKDKGYQPTDAIGKTGIEASYESTLRGTYGKKQVEVDALGREQSVLAEDDPVQGKDLTLTIDMGLQAAAEKALKRSALANGRGRGAAIAMDPKTGAILAMVSLPAYDANDFAKGISQDEYAKLAEDPGQPLYPRAISGLYPPGSTVKLIISAAALMEHVITPETTVLSTGGLHVGQWFFPDWKAGGHGVTNVVKAIAESINTFFYTVGGGYDRFQGLGVDRLKKYLTAFGLGHTLGVDLPGERDGFVPDAAWKVRAKKEAWYIGDTYHLSIGQGDLLVTPLQIAAWTAVFANGGDLVQPHAVQSIDSNGATQAIAPTVLKQGLVPPDIVQTVRKGMRQTVLAGSAQSLKLSPWTIAGKTGTAQWKTGQPNHAWFTGFAPFDDPKIVVTVLIEAGGEGSHSAVPVAREIMEAWLRKQGVKPTNAPDPAQISPENYLD